MNDESKRSGDAPASGIVVPDVAPLARAALPSRRARLLVALAVGLALGVLAWASAQRPGFFNDFAVPYTGVRLFLAGVNPYGRVAYEGVTIYGGGYLYNPLPALAVFAPFAAFSLPVGTGLFTGLAFAALTYRLTCDAWWPLWAVASGPAVYVASLGQWTPLLLLAGLSPPLGPLLMLKPSVGLAVFAARPAWRTVWISAVILLASVLVLPSWPLLWHRGAQASVQHFAPVGQPGGFLLLLGALRWRTPGGRLLAVLACVPHNSMFYDQLVLFLIPRTRRETVALALSMTVGLLAWVATSALVPVPYQQIGPPFTLAFCYLPALAMVLRHPNEGPMPAWVERAVAAVGQVLGWGRSRHSPAPGSTR